MGCDYEAAKHMILLHAGHRVDDESRSIVSSLRPYSGIREADFKSVVVALIGVKDALSAECIDRELIYACWDLCCHIRVLTKLILGNQIITDMESATLLIWSDCIESFCRRSMHKSELVFCLSHFLEYVASDACLSPAEYRDLIPFFDKLRGEADFEVKPVLETAIAVIGR